MFNQIANLAYLEWPENIGVGKPYDPDDRHQNYLLGYCHGKLGNKAERENYLDQVNSFTLQFPDKSGPNDLIGLLALKESKSKEEEQQLQNRLKSNSNPLNQWVVASYTNDQNTLKALQSDESNREYLESTTIKILDQIVDTVR